MPSPSPAPTPRSRTTPASPRTLAGAASLVSLTLSLLAVSACGADDADGAAAPWTGADTSSWTSDTNAPSDAWSSSDAAAPADTTPPPPPPEDPRDFDLRTPEAGGTWLYIPSAGLDALVVVDATNLAVHLVEVGVEPALVRALPDDGGAVVLNRGTADVSIVRPRARGDFDVTTLDVLPGHNRLVLSPDGAWAFAWFDPTLDGSGALQDVSAVRLNEGEEAVYNLAVGYRPTDVHFTAEGGVALFFCENGISGVVLDGLDADTFLPPIAVADDPFLKPVDREVVVTPDGAYAVVRDLVAPPRLTLVDLGTGARATLALLDWPSDLDMTPDGAQVIVPMKETQQVALVSVPDAFTWVPEDPDETPDGEGDEPPAAPDNPHVAYAFTGAGFGSSALTADASRALLFTTDGTMAIGMLDLAAAQVFIQPVAKAIDAALVSDDGTMAALIHSKQSGAEPSLVGVEAYSLLHLDSGFVKIMTVDHAIERAIFTADASELFVLMPDPVGASHDVHRVATASFAVTPYRTPYAPVYAGALPSLDKVAISLDNPTGWIVFVDTATDAVDHVNSFELNSFIR